MARLNQGNNLPIFSVFEFVIRWRRVLIVLRYATDVTIAIRVAVIYSRLVVLRLNLLTVWRVGEIGWRARRLLPEGVWLTPTRYYSTVTYHQEYPIFFGIWNRRKNRL